MNHWTELEITYDSLIVQFKITCVNADKAHTVLDVQYVDKGSDGEDPITRSVNPIPIPTIPSTIENDFIYKRWDSEFTKVFADRTITAVYEPSVRNYNVEYILTLVFGCSKADDGSYEKYAKGKIHWAKLWYSDLGDNECREIASWIHETIPMMVAKYKEYYLSDNATKRANITFIAKNLLSTNHSYGNITGGWSKSSLNTWLNTRLIKAVSPIWKSLIKKVNVTANNADKAKTTSTSECYFYLPSIHEIEPSISNDPYSIETDSTISYMTNDIARRRAKVSTPDQYEAYPTRSANVDQNVGTWQWGVDGGEDTPGKINGYYYPQTAGVLVMFSISCEG